MPGLQQLSNQLLGNGWNLPLSHSISRQFGHLGVENPQYEDNPSVFIESQQLVIGLEWERPTAADSEWISVYGSVAAGWRRERLLGEGALSGLSSSSVDRAVLIVGTGVRFYASTLGARWRYRIKTGVSAWFPASDAQLTIDTLSISVQKPTLALSVGVTFEFD